MKHTISIIIPVFNLQDHVAACLESVLAQTYEDLEIIVVDDGSSDNSPQILDAFAARDSRIRVIHQENNGVTRARLRGAAEAMGEYIGFVDGDDYVEPEMYQHLLENALASGAEISHCGYQMVFPNRTDLYYGTGKREKQSGREAVKGLIIGTFEPGLCNKLYRRGLLRGLLQSGGMDLSIRINEDFLMNYYLFRRAEIAFFEDICPYHYIIRKGSASNIRSNLAHLEDPLRVGEIILKETTDDEELNALALQSLTVALVRTASQRIARQPAQSKEVILSARRRLRELRPRIRSEAGTRLRLQAYWASVWPDSYRLVHWIRGEITGVNHKFDLD